MDFPAGLFLALIVLVWCLITTALFRPTSGDASEGRRPSPAAKFLRVGWNFVSGLMFVLVLVVMFMPSGFWTAQLRARTTRARHQLKRLASEVPERSKEGQLFPLPIDSEGNPVQATWPFDLAAEPVEDTTAEVALYYVGPSFLPDYALPQPRSASDFMDPFRDEGQGPYGYGAGAFPAFRALILTSRGPDRESPGEGLESLFLVRHRGDEGRFTRDPEKSHLVYSPTNGIRSRGDLYHTSSF